MIKVDDESYLVMKVMLDAEVMYEDFSPEAMLLQNVYSLLNL